MELQDCTRHFALNCCYGQREKKRSNVKVANKKGHAGKGAAGEGNQSLRHGSLATIVLSLIAFLRVCQVHYQQHAPSLSWWMRLG